MWVDGRNEKTAFGLGTGETVHMAALTEHVKIWQVESVVSSVNLDVGRPTETRLALADQAKVIRKSARAFHLAGSAHALPPMLPQNPRPIPRVCTTGSSRPPSRDAIPSVPGCLAPGCTCP